MRNSGRLLLFPGWLLIFPGEVWTVTVIPLGTLNGCCYFLVDVQILKNTK